MIAEWLEGIDTRAVIHPDAKIGKDVTVGPFSVVGPDVEIGDGSWIGPHVVFDGKVTVGRENRIYPYSVIGFPPQDLKYSGEPTEVRIGDRNVIREGSQVHRGTAGGLALTEIGNDCYLMALSHVAHDCRVGDNVLFANAGTLAGHVEVGDYATIGAYSGIHQFCRVGEYAFIGGYSVVTRDALPYCLTVGNRALCYGINRIGLRRHGFSREAIGGLEQATRMLFRQGVRRQEALTEVSQSFGEIPEVHKLVDFMGTSKRGVIPIRLGQGA
jgi:UDP-N-acetylglucosamine acyltransferase